MRALPVALAVYDEWFWPGANIWTGQFGLTEPAGIVPASGGRVMA
jgi:hypothetical protein